VSGALHPPILWIVIVARLYPNLLALISIAVLSIPAQKVYAQDRLPQNRDVQTAPDGQRRIEIPADQFPVETFIGVGFKRLEDGKLKEAESLFRGLLSVDPTSKNARFGLAIALMRQQRYDDARFHLEVLLQQKLNEEERALVEQMLAVAERAPQIDYSFGLSIIQDSNANRATDDEIITLGGLPFVVNEGSQADARLGVQAQGRVTIRQPLPKSLVASASLFVFSRDFSNAEFDDRILSPEFAVDWIGSNALGLRRFGGFFGPTFRWYGGDLLYTELRGGLRLSYGLTDELVADLEIAGGHIYYDDLGFLDRDIFDSRLTLTVPVTDKLVLFPIAGFENDDARTAFDSFKTTLLGLSGRYLLPYNMRVESTVLWRRRAFKDTPAIFGSFRNDNNILYQGLATITPLAVYGIAPQLGFEYEHQFSSVDLFDFNRYQFLLGFTSRF